LARGRSHRKRGDCHDHHGRVSIARFLKTGPARVRTRGTTRRSRRAPLASSERSGQPLRRAQGRGGGGWGGRTWFVTGQRRYVHNNPRATLTSNSLLIRDCVTSARSSARTGGASAAGCERASPRLMCGAHTLQVASPRGGDSRVASHPRTRGTVARVRAGALHISRCRGSTRAAAHLGRRLFRRRRRGARRGR